MNNRPPSPWIACALLPLLLTGCDRGGPDDAPPARAEAAPADDASPDHPNLIDTPASVRSNLGISFVKVERRRVEKTLRVPGRFEYPPHAQRTYRTPLPGRIELLAEQFQHVEEGDPLYRIDSPQWRELQQALTEAESQIDGFRAKLRTSGPLLEAHDEHETSLRETLAVWNARRERLTELNEAGGGRVDALTQASAALSSTRANLAEVREKKALLLAEQEQARAGVQAAQRRLRYLLAAAAAVTALTPEELTATNDHAGTDPPHWATLNTILVRSDAAGVVSEIGLTNGAWADQTASVLTVLQPDHLRFRASGLQSDLGALQDGLPARIVSPTPTATGRGVPIGASMTGTLMLGLEGDPDARTIDLFVVPDTILDWARAGVSAQLEIVTDASATAEWAVPLAAVQRDGLTPYLFRRTPDHPDQVMRMEADLGRNDGRWVEVLSGVGADDEIVLDGAFQLMLSTSGSIQKGGHFHADGTFHDGEH